MSNLIKTILFLVVSAFLTHLIPFSDFFRNLDTMIHEFGHAAVTLLLSGKVMYIELFSNHSGVTYSQVTRHWSLIPIALAGYMTASLFAVFLFRQRAKGRQRFGLQVMTVIAIVALAFFIRNEFGVMWVLGFIVLNTVMLTFMPRWLCDLYYLLVAFLTLEESVFGPFSLILYALQDPAQAGDATNLAKVTPIPSVGWAVFFTLFALWCAMRALRWFFSGRQRSPQAGRDTAYRRQYED
ncbi:M50 family metallopeptidase [Paenibacillus filicis]|uniref:M50 family metallopeptidase n=1 Tax=Paenibacillus gyeongsangnamensis TaxID=3388067 RepID=A0ABT4QAL5_9BACL|nr:M50 family metallopeptidase [Paenibacillus filicis]MCZ8513934.1 M50 family metallopeptidase [Paenibacillus filicis]